MAAIAGVSLSTPRVLARTADSKARPPVNSPRLSIPSWRKRRVCMQPLRAAPEGISEKVEQSIKSAEEACGEDPASGECVAAWDEVEELSAAASHARDKKKDEDPLETYCKDNPETDECRTYED